ncbi:MAG: mechanosensitive ion channel [Bacillota bacterium]|nr:mechanosensitive ion channel [Bacillota bacterium]
MTQEVIINYLMLNGIKILGSMIVLFFALKIVNRITKLLKTALIKAKYDETIINFLAPTIRISLKVIVIISIVNYLGVETTSLLAIIGGASFAVGLAFQGSLSNFAGGVLLLILKPFKIGDVVNVNGIAGTVKSISIFYTYLTSFDNKLEIIPNSSITNSSLTNFSANDTRRIAIKIGVEYGTDINLVKEAVKKIVNSNDKILDDPAYFVGLSEFGDSSLNFNIRVWVKTSDYWNVFYQLNEDINNTFNEMEIGFPYPHMDVNLVNNNN